MDSRAIAEFITRVLSDPRPSNSLPALYLFEQTADNQRAVLDLAVDCWRRQQVAAVALSAYGPRLGFPGFTAWRQELLQRGVPAGNIVAVENDGTGNERYHTLLEARTLVGFARALGWQRVGICAPAFHLPRAFLSAVSAREREFPALRIYAVAGTPLPWGETVTHSQGKLSATRRALIAGEMERVEKYQQQGDLVSLTQALAYLDERDQ